MLSALRMGRGNAATALLVSSTVDGEFLGMESDREGDGSTGCMGSTGSTGSTGSVESAGKCVL